MEGDSFWKTKMFCRKKKLKRTIGEELSSTTLRLIFFLLFIYIYLSSFSFFPCSSYSEKSRNKRCSYPVTCLKKYDRRVVFTIDIFREFNLSRKRGEEKGKEGKRIARRLSRSISFCTYVVYLSSFSLRSLFPCSSMEKIYRGIE